MSVFYSLIFDLVYFAIFFIIGLKFKNNGLVDIGWGIGLFLTYLFNMVYHQSFAMVSWILALLIGVWGIRLSYHIILRNIGKSEDFRYANWRVEWGEWVNFRAFFQIYMLQAIFMWFVSFAYLWAFPMLKQFNLIVIIGVFIWLVGFTFEAIGDWQLKKFVKNPANKNHIIENGLWKYSRHPNYFGEATLWWGIAIISFGVANNYLSFIGSSFITFSLLFISGVPMLEKRNQNKPGYAEYKARTSIFIPWFNKKTKE